ncbi:MAG TPA: hypothetical protein VIP27_08435 [Variovorax sp.]
MSIAAGILKENPAMQEPDLRKWAVKVLDENSPIAFSGKAKESLERGPRMQYMAPIYIPEPAEDCMEPPPDRTVTDQYVKLARYSQQKNVYGDQMLPKLHEFVEVVRHELTLGEALAGFLQKHRGFMPIPQHGTGEVEARMPDDAFGSGLTGSRVMPLKGKKEAVAGLVADCAVGGAHDGKA